MDQARRPPRQDREPDGPREAEQVRHPGARRPGPERGLTGPGGGRKLFRFVQFEFPWELGPAAGRYVLRDHASEAEIRVLVLSTLGARERRLIGRRRPRSVAPEPEPEAVATTRATVIQGRQVDEAAARAWLTAGLEPVQAELVLLNRVIALHRLAAEDAAAREVRLEQALVVRVGYGSGEEVADGRWTEAVEPAGWERGAGRRRRREVLRPQERLAALLGGRDAPLAAEELVLRARADLDAGRLREAALQLRVALEAALSELEPWRDRADLAGRIEALRAERGAVGDAANAALRAGLDEATAAAVERITARLEAALRARAQAALTPE